MNQIRFSRGGLTESKEKGMFICPDDIVDLGGETKYVIDDRYRRIVSNAKSFVKNLDKVFDVKTNPLGLYYVVNVGSNFIEIKKSLTIMRKDERALEEEDIDRLKSYFCTHPAVVPIEREKESGELSRAKELLNKQLGTNMKFEFTDIEKIKKIADMLDDVSVEGVQKKLSVVKKQVEELIKTERYKTADEIAKKDLLADALFPKNSMKKYDKYIRITMMIGKELCTLCFTHEDTFDFNDGSITKKDHALVCYAKVSIFEIDISVEEIKKRVNEEIDKIIETYSL